MTIMNESEAKKYGEAHAAAVVAGNFKQLGDDIDASARDEIAALAKELPNPVVEAFVDIREVSDSHAVIRIKYVGNSKSTTLQSTWKPSGDRYRIFGASLISD